MNSWVEKYYLVVLNNLMRFWMIDDKISFIVTESSINNGEAFDRIVERFGSPESYKSLDVYEAFMWGLSDIMEFWKNEPFLDYIKNSRSDLFDYKNRGDKYSTLRSLNEEDNSIFGYANIKDSWYAAYKYIWYDMIFIKEISESDIDNSHATYAFKLKACQNNHPKWKDLLIDFNESYVSVDIKKWLYLDNQWVDCNVKSLWTSTFNFPPIKGIISLTSDLII